MLTLTASPCKSVDHLADFEIKLKLQVPEHVKWMNFTLKRCPQTHSMTSAGNSILVP